MRRGDDGFGDGDGGSAIDSPVRELAQTQTRIVSRRSSASARLSGSGGAEEELVATWTRRHSTSDLISGGGGGGGGGSGQSGFSFWGDRGDENDAAEDHESTDVASLEENGLVPPAPLR